MKKYQVYLFDFDGTLFNTVPGLSYVFKKSFGSIGVNVNDDDVIWLSRVPLAESYAKYNGDPAKVNIFIKEIEKALDSKQSIETTEFYDDSKEFVDYLAKNKPMCGIVTSNNTGHVLKILSFFNLPKELFNVYIGSDIVKEIKPHPAPIKEAIKRLHYNGDLHDVVYVGDSHNDCQAALNAGVDTYLLDRGNAGDYPFPKIYSLMELFK